MTSADIRDDERATAGDWAVLFAVAIGVAVVSLGFYFGWLP